MTQEKILDLQCYIENIKASLFSGYSQREIADLVLKNYAEAMSIVRQFETEMDLKDDGCKCGGQHIAEIDDTEILYCILRGDRQDNDCKGCAYYKTDAETALAKEICHLRRRIKNLEPLEIALNDLQKKITKLEAEVKNGV